MMLSMYRRRLKNLLERNKQKLLSEVFSLQVWRIRSRLDDYYHPAWCYGRHVFLIDCTIAVFCVSKECKLKFEVFGHIMVAEMY
jgi:hypothetical protein